MIPNNDIFVLVQSMKPRVYTDIAMKSLEKLARQDDRNVSTATPDIYKKTA